MTQMNLSTQKKIMDLENRLVVAKEEGVVGWIGSLGLIDVDYCLWNGLAMRSCYVALGTMPIPLWWSMIMWENRMCTCMCNWVTMLYSRKKIVLGKIFLNKIKKYFPHYYRNLIIVIFFIDCITFHYTDRPQFI